MAPPALNALRTQTHVTSAMGKSDEVQNDNIPSGLPTGIRCTSPQQLLDILISGICFIESGSRNQSPKSTLGQG